MNTPSRKMFFEFGGFRLDTERHRLVHNTTSLPLTHKAVEILRVLIERRGEVVKREELMNAVWADVAVEDGNLSVAISVLRKALSEYSPENYIETFPRRGYKFVGDVREVFEQDSGIVVAEEKVQRVVIDEESSLTEPALLRFSSSFFKTFGRRAFAATVVSVALMGGIAAWFYSSRAGRAFGPSPRVRSIAVLPFKSIGAADQAADKGLGFADILITRLSNIKQINVRPTSAVLLFENTNENSTAIGRKLMVDAVLEGSVLQVNDKVRVTVRLIRVQDESSLWAGQFEKSSADQLQIQDEVALQVVDALALNLSGDEEKALTKRYTQSQDAYQLYLRGRYQWNKRNHEGLTEAQYLFRKAIESDPTFALAYVGLADSQMFAHAPSVEVYSVLDKAIELDASLGEAYASRGFLLSVHRWRWRDAEESFKKSIELNPGYATGHHWYAILLEIEGRYDEAKAEMRRALEINPMSYNFLADLGQIYYFNHEYDKAREYCEKALAIYPDFTFAHQYLSQIYLQTGDFESFVEEMADGFATLNAQRADTPQVRSTYRARLREQYRSVGIRGFLKKQLEGERSGLANRYYGDALVFSLLEDEEKAITSLELALDNKAFLMPWVKSEPIFDRLRSQPRFKAILQKLNLPPDA